MSGNAGFLVSFLAEFKNHRATFASRNDKTTTSYFTSANAGNWFVIPVSGIFLM